MFDDAWQTFHIMNSGGVMKEQGRIEPLFINREKATSERSNLRASTMDVRGVTIKMEDGSSIKGNVNLRTEPTREVFDSNDPYQGIFYYRISDLFANAKNPFIALFNANLDGHSGKVVIINKSKILYVIPED